MLRHKYINYANFYSNLQLPACTASGGLQKITSLIVRHLTGLYFPEPCGY